MLTALVSACVRHAAAVVVLALGLLAVALGALGRLPVDVFPDLEGTRVTVLTEAPGLATEEVERLVTMPVERALLGVRGVDRVRSTSVSGLSITYVDFEDGGPIEAARQRVAERITTVSRDLPPGLVPAMGPEASLTGEIVQVTLVATEEDPAGLELRSWAEFELRPRLLSVRGVAQVSVMGGRLPELAVIANQSSMRAFDVSLGELAGAVGRAHSTGSSGYLPDDAGRELEVAQRARVGGEVDLAAAVLRPGGTRPVRVSDVAEITMQGAPRRGSAGVAFGASDGVTAGAVSAVVLGVTKAPGTNTLDVTAAVDAVLAGSSPPQGARIDARFARHASFIERAVARVRAVAFEAAVVVSAVLLAFLLNLRTALIALCALPLSLGITALWLGATGGGLDVMTLGGMAIAIGVLVDDAIIDVENVLRRLRINRAQPEGERRAVPEVVIAATGEIRPAMVQATFILALAFLPLMFLEGLEGKFFRPLGATFVVALLASLAVALTVTPALCRLLLRGTGPAAGAGGHGPLARALLRMYRPVLGLVLRARAAVLLGATALVVAAGLLAAQLGTSFLPTFHEGMATVFVYAPPGTSLTESEALADAVVERVASVEGVAAVARRTGRAERDEHVEPVWNSELEVAFEDPSEASRLRGQIEEALAGLPGITTGQGQPIEHRLSHVLSGTAADLTVELYHEDQGQLEAAAATVAAALSAVPGLRNVNAQRSLTVEGLTVDWDREALTRLGLTAGEAAEQLRLAVEGEKVGRLVDGARWMDLVVRLDRDQRQSATDVRGLQIVTPFGARVRADQLARIEVDDVPAMLLRQGGRRKAVVTCGLESGANLGDSVEAARQRLRSIEEAMGVEIRYAGQHEAAQRGRRTLLLAGLASLGLGVILLRSTVRSWTAAMVIALNLPLAAVGGVLALFLVVDQPLANLAELVSGSGAFRAPVVSLSTLVGFAALFGIALRGGVLLGGRWEALTAEGVPVEEAIRTGIEDRMVPILMTALTAAFGLLPVVLASGEPGTELLAPLAVVVLGGLISSTVLNLVVLPAAYAMVRRPSVGSPA
ncbi:MAG: efflux RND transporter permease subunit [Planctomycetes bacterium]|nr:efflux RND transporter permease subunit [Planctomycetota bacterium]